MRISFELAAEFRDRQGKGASRRLRHAGRVPAILYGGSKEPRAITLNHQKLMTLVDNEKFYSSIINLKVGDVLQAAIVKDLQMHPARNAISMSTCSAWSRPRRSASSSRSTSRVKRRRLA
jgi:large subunit ribosomal protein L25